MSNKRFVQIINKFTCSFIEYVPDDLLDKTKQIEISDEDRLALGRTKCFDVENNCVIDYDNSEDLKKQKLDELRTKRKPLLQAFDCYKTNVNYGIENETEEQKLLILEWYNAILNLNEQAISNVPEKIQYYMGGI